MTTHLSQLTVIQSHDWAFFASQDVPSALGAAHIPSKGYERAPIGELRELRPRVGAGVPLQEEPRVIAPLEGIDDRREPCLTNAEDLRFPGPTSKCNDAIAIT